MPSRVSPTKHQSKKESLSQVCERVTAFNGVSDIILALWPTTIIAKLRISLKRKIGVCVLMGVGVLAAACCAVRIYETAWPHALSSGTRHDTASVWPRADHARQIRTRTPCGCCRSFLKIYVTSARPDHVSQHRTLDRHHRQQHPTSVAPLPSLAPSPCSSPCEGLVRRIVRALSNLVPARQAALRSQRVRRSAAPARGLREPAIASGDGASILEASSGHAPSALRRAPSVAAGGGGV